MNRLRELRIERELLQSDIAKLINKSERTVGFYETGERDMNTETLAILANFFNVSIDYLLGKSTIRNPEDYKYAYNRPKEAEGLSDEEVNDALRFYKEMKKKIEGENK